MNANVKKAKTKLGEVAAAAERSIPKIATESNKASRSLKDVSEAGDKVKKTLDSIGDKAKSSLSRITGDTGKITSAFQKLGLAGRVAATGMNVDSTTASLEEMKDTMESIARIDLFGALATQSSKIANIFGGIKIKNAMKKQAITLRDSYIKQLAMEFHDFDYAISMGDLDDDEAKAWGEDLIEKIERAGRSYKQATEKVKAATKAVRLEISKLTSAFISVASAIMAVVLPINALSISKMAREIDVAAQRAGFSAQAFQEWTYVLERAGIEAGELGEVMKTLTESQVDVISGSKDMIAAYEQLGISAAEVASLNQEQLWNRTVNALQNVENATLRTSIAYQIFGEDAAKLATLLNMSNQ